MTDQELLKFTYNLVEKLEDKVYKLEDEIKNLKNTNHITINTHGCDTKSPQEIAKQLLKNINYKGL